MKSTSRRNFLKSVGVASAAATVVPSNVIAGMGHKAPSDKLNIVGIGIGGKGSSDLKEMEAENIIGLCDVDHKYAAHTFNRYPKAKTYKDFRRMYDEMGSSIDAVVCATADHTHAVVSATALEMGKHVYCQKPLTHTVYESRLLTKLAETQGVATQMGNQGASGDGVSEVCEWIWSGEIGEITHVEAFTDRPIWPQGLNTPENGDWVPETLDWDLFTGPAKMKPFNEVYHPWNWRGWWDYGTGALGDMACHILHPVFVSLGLGYPTKAQGSSTLLLEGCAPSAQMVDLTFPKRSAPEGCKIKMPEVKVTWYDGGLKPEMPEGWPAGRDMNNSGGGVIFHGTKDKVICGCYGKDPWLLSGRVPKNVPQKRRRIENHYTDWVEACKEPKESRRRTASLFAEAGPFNEMVVMGVLAVRLQTLNKELHWDGPNMKFTNIGPDEEIKICTKDDFKIHDGHPTFNKTWTDPMNAQKFSQELIKHTYRDGWALPKMPK